MELGDFLSLVALGIPVGFLSIAILSGPERAPYRRKFTRWCLVFGSVASVMLGAVVFSGIHPLPSKGLFGAAFIGLPALPCGLLLRAYEFFFQRGKFNGHA